MTNCINCGAILHGDKCEYCGTEYNQRGIEATFNTDDFMGVMNVNGEDINVYIAKMEARFIGGDSGRNANGKLFQNNPRSKRIFTVVEM